MRHGSALMNTDGPLVTDSASGPSQNLPFDAQSLGRRLIAFARVAAAMHTDALAAAEPPGSAPGTAPGTAPGAEPPADLSLASILGRVA